MRVLLWSNSPWTLTGYGKQTKAIAGLLQDLGHEVAILGLSGLLCASLDWGGITVYPAHEHPLGADVIGYYANHFAADVVLSLYDVWAFPADTRQCLPCPWIALIPVDGAPVSERMLRRIQTVDYPVAFSLFGKHELWKAGIEADYIPLGIDCQVFVPGDKAAARAQLGIPPGVFLVTMVAANKGFPARKSWPEALAAFAGFHRRHPDSFLYLHTTKKPYGSEGRGIYFDALIEALDIPPSAVTFADQGELAIGIPDEQMATIYQASDVLLSPSMGEGFGLPIAEAQACGCSVITQNCSAMSELTCNGIAVEPLQPMWIPPLGYWWQQASIENIETGLDVICELSQRQRKDMARAGIKFVREHYNWPVVVGQHWRPFLEQAEAGLW